MSQPRFAAVTAELLARKGEARPWAESSHAALGHAPVGKAPVDKAPVSKAPLAWAMPVPETPPAAAPVSAGAGDCRKIAVRMSGHDYQRLGILAVKQGSTRQRLLQDAVERLFTGLSQNCGAGCACLGPER